MICEVVRNIVKVLNIVLNFCDMGPQCLLNYVTKCIKICSNDGTDQNSFQVTKPDLNSCPLFDQGDTNSPIS